MRQRIPIAQTNNEPVEFLVWVMNHIEGGSAAQPSLFKAHENGKIRWMYPEKKGQIWMNTKQLYDIWKGNVELPDMETGEVNTEEL